MATDAKYRTVTLAHPMQEKYAKGVNALVPRDYEQGEEIEVPRGQLVRMVSAGLVEGVAPTDAEAIRDLLDPPAEPVAEPVPAAVPVAPSVPGEPTPEVVPPVVDGAPAARSKRGATGGR
ncbi:MAG: hypothetical protein JWL97_4237 [Gemmatimonadales bacterium]|nr:hypothetical protein [Gemmatimonadales bacterium]